MCHQKSEEEKENEKTFLDAYNKIYGKDELIHIEQLAYITFDKTNMDDLIELCEMYYKTKTDGRV